jgi:hypothetical protein
MGGFKLDWQHWLYGLVAAGIGGGAGAVVTAGSANVVLPNTVNLDEGFHTMMLLFKVSFIAHALISVAFYLQKSPLPAIEETTKATVSLTTQEGQPPKVTSTVVETRTESK